VLHMAKSKVSRHTTEITTFSTSDGTAEMSMNQPVNARYAHEKGKRGQPPTGPPIAQPRIGNSRDLPVLLQTRPACPALTDAFARANPFVSSFLKSL
jgi:hypothetical protein